MTEDPRGRWRSITRWEPLSDDEVRIIRFDLKQPAARIAALAELLSPLERDQAARYTQASDRRRFIVRRGFLRVVLGQALGREPGALQIRAGAFGKPFLSGSLDSSPLRFNLAHCEDTALCALAWGREVGIDIEHVDRGLDPSVLVLETFTPDEIEALEALDPGDRVDAFFAGWTRKEAYLKARGTGFHLPPTTCWVALNPRDPAPALSDLTAPGERPAWSLRSVTPQRGFAAAVAAEGAGWRLQRLRWAA